MTAQEDRDGELERALKEDCLEEETAMDTDQSPEPQQQPEIHHEPLTPPLDPLLRPAPSPCSDSCSPQVSPSFSPTQELSQILQAEQDTEEEQQEDEEAVIEDDDDEEDETEEIDPSRSEGLVQFAVKKFSELDRSTLSEPVLIRNLPWRIMVMPKRVGSVDKRAVVSEEDFTSMGVFVQCNPDNSDTPGWSVSAHARIMLVNQQDRRKTYRREIQHYYSAKENDWGFSNFMAWKDVADPHRGFIKDDTVLLKARVWADAPHGINWDSKKYTGFVGLKNQGATCYMNSLLQTLFCTSQLRKSVYEMPTESDDTNKSIAFALQRLFYDLQHSDKPVGTKKLTKAFGWDTLDIFMQHDVQELCRVLLDNIDSKMKGTVVEGTISGLFEGKMESYLKCTKVEYVSARVEPFFDIQLNVKGMKSVYESFKDYVAVEVLDGENMYDAGCHGLQPAEKGVTFLCLPPVLHLQLMRFQYDPITDTNVKINDRYEFPEKLDLSEFLKEPEEATYTLHSVLVHSGDNHGGHYVAYICPTGDSKRWLKFDDDVVSQCTRRQAVHQNYGGSEDSMHIRSCTNAYMLSYIRDSHLEEVLQEVADCHIPGKLVTKLLEEKKVEAQRRKERSEAPLYMSVEIFQEADLQRHHGVDLVDFEDIRGIIFRFLKTETLPSMLDYLSDSLGSPVRVWPFERRGNNTNRPTCTELPEDAGKTIHELAEWKPIWRVFTELLPDKPGLAQFPAFDFQNEVLLFFKYYDPFQKSVSYTMYSVENVETHFSDLFGRMCEAIGLPPETPLLLYEEVTAGRLDPIDPNSLITQLEEIRDGDIICYQRADLDISMMEYPKAPDYFRELHNRLDVRFVNKNIPHDKGFVLTLKHKMTYTEMANAVGKFLDFDPHCIQFIRPNVHRQLSDQTIRYTTESNLRELVSVRNKMDPNPLLYYQKLTIPVVDFEEMRWFKFIFINSKLKEEKEITVYVNKNGTVRDLLEKAEKELPNCTGKLRLLDVMGNRVVDIFSLEKPVSEMVSQKVYRIEEETDAFVMTNEALIPVAHFQKMFSNTFGVPFLLKIKDGEKLSQVKNRIQVLLEVSDKEFDKWKFAIVNPSQPVVYLSEGELDEPLYLSQFGINPEKNVFPRLGIPWLGLDHYNRNPKRARYAFERAIKIRN